MKAVPVLVLLFLCLPATSRADIVVGDYLGDGIVRIFADDANGNVAPIRTIGGTAAGMTSIAGGAYDSTDNTLYLANFYDNAIRVFPAYASGNIAPLRILNPGILGQPRTVVIDAVHNELFTTTSGCCLGIFQRNASGSDAPIRNWAWGGNSQTELNNPYAIVHDAESDEILVGETEGSNGKVLVFDRDTGSSYNSGPPKRKLQGGQTQLDGWIGGLAIDTVQQQLYVLVNRTNQGGSYTGKILVFDLPVGGDVAPVRSIQGVATQLDSMVNGLAQGLTIDPQRQVLIATRNNWQTPSANAVLVFSMNGSGNIAPLQVISGDQTGITGPGQPIWMPKDGLFENGFD